MPVRTRRFVVRGAARRLDRLVAELVPELSRSRAADLIRQGRVRLDGAAARPSSGVPAGVELEVELPPPPPSTLEAEDLGLVFLHRDADLAVLDKPAGLVVHPAPGHPRGTLVHGLLHALDELSTAGGRARPGIVHRLDRGTSGVMVVACNDVAHRRLQRQFSDHSVERRYLALAWGRPDLDAGIVNAPIGRDPRHRKRFAVSDEGRRAVTRWRVVERLGPATLVECRLETGRTHQVRVHMLHAGMPLLGEPVYRRRRGTVPAGLEEGAERPMLHASVLGFDHPRTGRRMRFQTAPPADFQRVLARLRRG